MHPQFTPGDPPYSPVDPPHRHERTDADTRQILIVGGFLFGLIVFALIIVSIVINVMGTFPATPARPPSAFAGQQVPVPGPRLQYAPYLDLRQLRAREDTVLETYGWVNQKSGVVRMPIERAIDLLAQRGLPARTGAVVPDTGADVATGPLGRTGNAERGAAKGVRP
jgi:hypothetical protein